MDVRVSRLTGYIAGIFKSDPILMNLGVIGEISNLKYHSSGSLYFTLKDDKASIRCQMWERYASRLRYRLEDGMEVRAAGRVSVYEKGGTYSLIVEDLEALGEGALMAAYRALYQKLSAEGLFSQAHKKPLPEFPGRVCIITSKTGAAIQDMLKIIRNRNQLVNILVYPVLVQGADAAGEISAAVRDVNERFADCDVIIIGRGGGSLEDLWAFNEEPVARAVYDSVIPVISAVGHETDFTIADFAADARAETPTAAAVMAVPDLQQVRKQMREIFLYGIRSRLEAVYLEKEKEAARCAPSQLIQSLKHHYVLKSESLKRYDPLILGRSVMNRSEKYSAGLEQMIERVKRSVQERLRENRNQIEKCRIMLESADPDRIVQRGYAIVTDDLGKVVTGAADLQKGNQLTIRLKDGTVRSEVVEIMEITDGG